MKKTGSQRAIFAFLPIFFYWRKYNNNRKEMLHLQHFYNKSQVVSCYWFKFETNTNITFLPQQ